MLVENSRREFLARCATSLGAAALPNLLPAQSPPTESQQPTTERRKKLIAWGWDTAYPEKIQANIRKIEEMPFDGIVLSYFKAKRGAEEVMFEWRCFGKEQFEREQLAGTIETLRQIEFRRFTDNFLRFNVQPGDVDWFDDFGPILHNARLWAEIALETGMKGWKFDVEDYTEKLFTYSKQKYVKQKSFEEYATQVRLRGKEVIEAIQAGYPDITLLLSLAHSYVNRFARDSAALATISDYGLLPAFIDGLLEGVGARVKLIDGQEQAYGYLTPEEYFRGYHSVRQGALVLVPTELQNRYREKLDVGTAIWANFQLGVPDKKSLHWPARYASLEDRVRLFEQSVYYALKTADEYAWLYSEEMSWWEEGFPTPTPPGALDAIRTARRKLENHEPLGFDMTNTVQQARLQMEQATKPKP